MKNNCEKLAYFNISSWMLETNDILESIKIRQIYVFVMKINQKTEKLNNNTHYVNRFPYLLYRLQYIDTKL